MCSTLTNKLRIRRECNCNQILYSINRPFFEYIIPPSWYVLCFYLNYKHVMCNKDVVRITYTLSFVDLKKVEIESLHQKKFKNVWSHSFVSKLKLMVFFQHQNSVYS